GSPPMTWLSTALRGSGGVGESGNIRRGFCRFHSDSLPYATDFSNPNHVAHSRLLAEPLRASRVPSDHAVAGELVKRASHRRGMQPNNTNPTTPQPHNRANQSPPATYRLRRLSSGTV